LKNNCNFFFKLKHLFYLLRDAASSHINEERVFGKIDQIKSNSAVHDKGSHVSINSLFYF